MSFRNTISWILFPLTMWYAIGVWFRNFLFSVGIKKQSTPQVTTVGVGNLCAGGAGKTPFVEYLLHLFSEQYSTALLSRGYARKTKGYVLDDGNHDPSLLGDEPAMIARKYPKVTVAVCEKRVEGTEKLLSSGNPPQLIVLDDVFQHRYIKPTVNILLTEYHRPFYKDFILPFGNLREGRAARFRANIVIVTKSPEQLKPLEKHSIITRLKLRPYQKVFFSYIHYCDPLPLLGFSPLPLNTLDSVLIVTGIAHPETMHQYVRGICPTVTTIKYSDHHKYTLSDIKRIRKAFDHLSGDRKIILTTEKDAARLRELAAKNALIGLPVYYMPIEVRIHQNDEDNFDQTIQTIVKENILFLNRVQKAKFNF